VHSDAVDVKNAQLKTLSYEVLQRAVIEVTLSQLGGRYAQFHFAQFIKPRKIVVCYTKFDAQCFERGVHQTRCEFWNLRVEGSVAVGGMLHRRDIAQLLWLHRARVRLWPGLE
jgi:hypothetical protein